MKKTLLAILVCSLLLASCQKYDRPANDSSDETDEILSSQDSSSEDSANNSNDTSSGDNSSDASDSSDDSSETSGSGEMFDFSLLSKEELAEYITLGEYKGLESEKIVITVTEKDIEDEINNILESHGEWVEVKDEAIAKGDYVTMDFVGYMDGVAFEGGTGTDQSITIGEGKYIDGFEDGLIGSKSGEKVSLNLKFPDDYGREDFNGKAVVFDVTVKSVKRFVLPELTEEIIKEYTDEKATTEKEFKEFLKAELYETFQREEINLAKSEYWEKVMANATVIKFPDGVIDDYINAYVEYYQQYASLYGVTIEEFLGCTLAEFKEQMTKEAEDNYKSQMVLYAAMYAEDYDYNIVKEEYDAWVEEFAKLLGVSVEQFVEQYSEETIQNTYIFDKFLDYVYNTRTEVEPKEDTSKEDTSK